MPETFTVIELSTAHVTAEVAQVMDLVAELPAGSPVLLPFGPEDWRYHVTATPWLDYGWWMLAEIESGDDLLPDCLKACIARAERAGARYIRFDRDAVVLEELPTYEW